MMYPLFQKEKNQIPSDNPIQESVHILLNGSQLIIVDEFGFLGENLLESIRDELFRLTQRNYIHLDQYENMLNNISLCDSCDTNNLQNKHQTVVITLNVSWNFK